MIDRLYWACISALFGFLFGAMLSSCAPRPASSIVHTPARLSVHRWNAKCSAVRTGPNLVTTAGHCGAPLWTAKGELVPLLETPYDVAEHLDLVGGTFSSAAHYTGEVGLILDLQRGIVSARAQLSGMNLLELDAWCYPGDSGSPVYSANGVVAIVVARTIGQPKCWASLILP